MPKTNTDYLSELASWIFAPSYVHGYQPSTHHDFPKPVSIVYQRKKVTKLDKNGNPVKDENGKKIKELGNYLTFVMFDDGIRVQVSQGENDAFDLEKAFMYAIVKRLYGKLVYKVDKDGRDVIEVDGNGYNIMLKKVFDKAVDQDALKKKHEEKKEAVRAKEKADEKNADRPHPEVKISKMSAAQKKDYRRWSNDNKQKKSAAKTKKSVYKTSSCKINKKSFHRHH